MAPKLPLPSPSPSPPPNMAMSAADALPLSGRINAATREQHTELNRLLLHRLPLALPPHQTTPILLGKGLVVFTRLFVFFEHEWDLLATRYFQNGGFSDVTHHDHVRRWLAQLRPQGLARAPRLNNDLTHLRRMEGSNAMYKTAALDDSWTREMSLLMQEKPHVFVAFAWVLYMATFSGGRWIRQQLAKAGDDFWALPPGVRSNLDKEKQDLSMDIPGFSFLSFDGDQDGEDIKATFKLRLVDAEIVLNQQEQQEVIDAAGRVFDRCINLVNEVDRIVAKEQAVGWASAVLPACTVLLLACLLLLYISGILPPPFTRV